MADVQLDTSMTAASLAGASAAALANRSADSRARVACEGLAGALVGIFCGPAIADAAGFGNEHLRMATGFGTGAGGILLLTAALDMIKAGGLKAWLQRFIPGP
jgi:hypothetical protein